jgi:hypothetical protein
MISTEFESYIFDLIKEGTDPKYSIDIHEQSLNLAGLIIHQHESNSNL